jgi:hypothetical protein
MRIFSSEDPLYASLYIFVHIQPSGAYKQNITAFLKKTMVFKAKDGRVLKKHDRPFFCESKNA